MNCEDYRAILSAEIHSKDPAKWIEQYFIVQMSSVPNHTAKAAQVFLNSKKYCQVIFFFFKSVSRSKVNRACFSLAEDRAKVREISWTPFGVNVSKQVTG